MLTQQEQKITRVLIATQNRLLGESIQSEVNDNQAFEASVTVATSLSLMADVEGIKADVIVFLNEAEQEPGIISHLFDAYPGIVVVVLYLQSGDAVVCKQCLSEELVPTANLLEVLQRLNVDARASYWGKVS